MNALQMSAERAVEDRPRHVPAPKVALNGLKIVREANQRIVAVSIQLNRQRADVFRRIGISEDIFSLVRLNDHRDHVGFAVRQRSRRLIRHIARGLNNGLNALHRIRGNPVVVSVDDV